MGKRPGAYDTAIDRTVGRSFFKEPSHTSATLHPSSLLFLLAPSGSHYTPAHGWMG